MLCNILFLLLAGERNEGDLLFFGKAFDGGDKPCADFVHQHRRGKEVSPVLPEKVCNPAFGLKMRYVAVQVHAVDAFKVKCNFAVYDRGNVLWYTHGGTPVEDLLKSKLTA